MSKLFFVTKPKHLICCTLFFASLHYCSISQAASAEPVAISAWQFDKNIQPNQRQTLKTWLSEVQAGVTRLLGPSPDQYEVHIHQKGSSHSPVPWAHTSKGSTRQVHFYVDTNHAWSAFRSDWTAAHEMSHMLFPYVGEDRWFAEGLASYLQYQVMYAAGHITWDAAVTKIEERFRRVIDSQVPSDWSVLKHNARLREHSDYPRLYWGGAAYFAKVDRQLSQDRDIRLIDVISAYTQCCYTASPAHAMSLLQLFDELSASDVFMTIYANDMLTDQTPKTETLGAWLRSNPPKLQLANADR